MVGGAGASALGLDITWLKDWPLWKLRCLGPTHLKERSRRERSGATRDALPAHPLTVALAAACGLLGSHSPGLRPWLSSVGLSGHSSGELGVTPAPSSDSLSTPWSCSSLGLPGSWNQHELCELIVTPVPAQGFVRTSERSRRQPGTTVLHPLLQALDISGRKTGRS